MKVCDLHSHSNCSDGTFAPRELVSLAKEIGLSALALTDHNTAKGLHEFMEAGKKLGVTTVPGCEFSTEYNGTELHIVGLFLSKDVWGEIEDFVELMHMAKRESNKRLIRALNDAGYKLTYEEVANSTDADEFNRAHVARVLTAKGYTKSVNEAFGNLLKEKHGYYIPPKKLASLYTVKFIKAIGGTAVLAHPFLNMSYDELCEFLPKAKEAGLDAIETHYSKFTPQQTAQAEELAKRFGLKQSGGSDFHGETKPDISLGTGLGNLAVPYEFYENLIP
ncbi:MAG: PHP domain-containing protein [Eubacterium sp.]|nr:PHP domain-containing protein [Eubacterium sp.]